MNFILHDLKAGAVHAAPLLLGHKLVHETPEGLTSGYIVEVEAYTSDDPASHTYKGQTLRNASMFKEAGTVYIYFIYGVHYCMNIVTGEKGHGEGILIRALQPAEGVELMARRRGISNERQLTNGPGKLVQAMAISREQNGCYLGHGPLRLEPGFTPERIVSGPRIGVRKAIDLPRRFYIADNPFVSR